MSGGIGPISKYDGWKLASPEDLVSDGIVPFDDYWGYDDPEWLDEDSYSEEGDE
jgi:hypothetical protein